jgi:hypothetical protein
MIASPVLLEKTLLAIYVVGARVPIRVSKETQLDRMISKIVQIGYLGRAITLVNEFIRQRNIEYSSLKLFRASGEL